MQARWPSSKKWEKPVLKNCYTSYPQNLPFLLATACTFLVHIHGRQCVTWLQYHSQAVPVGYEAVQPIFSSGNVQNSHPFIFYFSCLEITVLAISYVLVYVLCRRISRYYTIYESCKFIFFIYLFIYMLFTVPLRVVMYWCSKVFMEWELTQGLWFYQGFWKTHLF